MYTNSASFGLSHGTSPLQRLLNRCYVHCICIDIDMAVHSYSHRQTLLLLFQIGVKLF